MERFTDKAITIYEAMQNIKNEKYVMPAFQRQYVWSLEQVEKLWDSILLDYPISNFLFWHIDNSNVSNDTYFCSFLTEVIFNNRKQSDSPNYELGKIDLEKTDTAILDGQQRLTSLYLSLFGEALIRQKYARRVGGAATYVKFLIELNRHKVDLDDEEFNNKKYDIRFSDKVGRLSPTQFEIKTILKNEFKNESSRSTAIENAISKVPNDSKDYARKILTKLCDKIYTEKLIRYTEITNMTQDDALEMFVRFNSGGSRLRKSEITMSILEAYWANSKSEFGKILTGAYANFSTDFIIRSALMLYGDVIKSNLNKQTAESLKSDWSGFKKALKNLETTLKEIRIDVSRFSSSWNVLIPIIYFIYYNPNYHDNINAIRAYLVRAVLFTYFQSGTTSKLQQMKSKINDNDYEITIDMLDQMSELHITESRIEDIVNTEKGSRIAGEALYFLSLDWRNNSFKYEQDHLHPASRFDLSKPMSITPSQWFEWRSLRNRLPNLQLLEGSSNGSKSNQSLIDYYNEKNDQQKQLFKEEALIPENVSLEFDDFETFYRERKKLIIDKLNMLLN